MRRAVDGKGQSVIFIPVSGSSGAGEYYRCLAIAKNIQNQAPDIAVHFLLAEGAAVERDPRFQYHVLRRSPSMETAAVIDKLRAIHPTAVVFDSSIRTTQLRAAHNLGAHVIIIVSRPAKRRKLLRPHKLRYVQAAWIIGAPAHQQRLRLMERLGTLGWQGELRFAGTILPPETDNAPEGSIFREPFVLVAPGGGAGARERLAAFSESAQKLATEHGIPVLYVAGPLSQDPLPDGPNLKAVRSLSPAALAEAMRKAHICLLGGGSILMQGLGLGKPCIAMPAGGRDQPNRIKELAKAKLIITPTNHSADAVTTTVAALWENPVTRQALAARLLESGFQNAGPEMAKSILSNTQG